MSTPAPDKPESFLQTISEVIDEHGVDSLPWYLRKPHPLASVAAALLTTVLLGAVVASGWGMFLVPLGVPAIGLWAAVGLMMTIGLIRFRTPTDYQFALLMEQTYQVDADPVRLAHLQAIRHVLAWGVPVILLLAWAALALVGCLV